MTEFRQNPVSGAIWPWQKAVLPAAKTGSIRRRGLKAAVQCAVMLVMAYVLGVRLGHRIPGVALTVLAVFVLVTGLALPRVFDAFEKGVGWFAQGVGVALTWILLVPFFYLVFVPGRWVLTLRGKDPLNLKFPSDEPTYWVDWKPPPTKEHYSKQYR